MSLTPKIFTIKARRCLKEIKYAPVEKAIQLVVPQDHQAVWLRKYHQWRRSLRPQIQQQLTGIRQAHPEARAVIVFTPGLTWERQLFQRPQQLALALAKRGALVFYTQLAPYQGGPAIQAVAERLYVCALPLEQLAGLGQFYIYTLTWNRKYLLKFNRPRLIYDYVDDIAAFEGDAYLHERDHRALLDEAEIVLATARLLHEEARLARPDALLVPNGVDFAHFNAIQAPAAPVTAASAPAASASAASASAASASAASAPAAPPADMAQICSQGKPVIGYYGALAHWFDYALMGELAALRADLNFVLIGTNHDGSLDASGLLGRENIHYLGPKPYAELPAYLALMDVALLPFKINRVTQSTSPLKLFEYCAGGKPVVATPLAEVTPFPEILTGADAPAFSQRIDQALALRGDPAYLRRLEQIGRDHAWENHAERILQAIAARQPAAPASQKAAEQP